MKTFEQVARSTQRQWLKNLATAALPYFGIQDAKLRFISESASFIYKVTTPYGEYALRVNPEPTTSKWLVWTPGELLWLQALRRDLDLRVPEPVQTLDGDWVIQVPTDRIPAGRLVTLLRWMPGKAVSTKPSTTLLTQMGAFMARLHQHTEAFTLPTPHERPYTDWTKLNDWSDPDNDTSDLLTPGQRQLLTEAAARLLAEISTIGVDRDYGLVHADFTLKNCLIHQGELGVIDFADTRHASHYFDIAVPLTDLPEYWQIDAGMDAALRNAFYAGYSRVRPLGSRYQTAVETFITARAFDVVEWIHLDWPYLTYHPEGPLLLDLALRRIQHYMRA